MKIILFLSLILSSIFSYSQNIGIGIGTTTPHASAALEIKDSTKGILIPRMTMVQRNAIANPAEGLMVYQTDSVKGFWYFEGSEWKNVIFRSSSNSPSFQHYIGENFGGGIIFNVYKDSNRIEHGLIVSLEQLGDYTLYSNLTTSIGINAQSSWDGKQNTNSIINQNGQCCSCAQNCTDYRGGGFSDWFLPSINQLGLLWDNFFEVSKSLSVIQGAQELTRCCKYWWSSTEYSAGEAYEFGFYNGEIRTWYKQVPQASHGICRPIRSF